MSSESNANATMASSAHEQHSIKQRLAAAATANGDQEDTQMQEDSLGESRNRDHKLTKQNLKSIPDADQLAPGIRLPAERLTGDLDLNPNGNGNGNSQDLDSNGQDNGIGRDGEIQEDQVATVPPELDPRTAEFRPPSPSAASVFSVAVQAPGSPRPETASILGDSTSSSSASAFRNSSSNSRPSSIRGSSPPLSASSDAVSFNQRITPGGGLGLNSAFARSSLGGGGGNQVQGNLMTSTAGSGSQSLREGEGPSLAPSEAGSSSSDSRSIANSNPRLNGRNNRDRSSLNGEDELMNEDDDDERVEVGSSNSKNSSSRGEFDGEEDSEEVKLRALYIERQRMHERELMGGEAGVGGLSSLNSKGILSYPFSASLRQEQEDSRNLNSGGGSGFSQRLPSRAGSTTATVGTSSPPQSLSGVSDYGDNDRARDDNDRLSSSLSRRGSTDTINSTGGTSFKAPSFVDSNGRRGSRSEAVNSPVPMDESA